MTDTTERDKLITQRYVIGERLAQIARLYGLKSANYVRDIAKKNGAKPRKNGRPCYDPD